MYENYKSTFDADISFIKKNYPEIDLFIKKQVFHNETNYKDLKIKVYSLLY